MPEITSIDEETQTAQGKFSEGESTQFLVSALLFMLKKYGPQEISTPELSKLCDEFESGKASFHCNFDLEKKITHVSLS